MQKQELIDAVSGITFKGKAGVGLYGFNLGEGFTYNPTTGKLSGTWEADVINLPLSAVYFKAGYRYNYTTGQSRIVMAIERGTPLNRLPLGVQAKASVIVKLYTPTLEW